MTASIEVARQAEAPGALISRGPGASLQPRSARRRDLETATAFFGGQTPVPLDRDRLQATLDDVIAEQDDRKRLAGA
jgi:hypothetical protein